MWIEPDGVDEEVSGQIVVAHNPQPFWSYIFFTLAFLSLPLARCGIQLSKNEITQLDRVAFSHFLYPSTS